MPGPFFNFGSWSREGPWGSRTNYRKYGIQETPSQKEKTKHPQFLTCPWPCLLEPPSNSNHLRFCAILLVHGMVQKVAPSESFPQQLQMLARHCASLLGDGAASSSYQLSHPFPPSHLPTNKITILNHLWDSYWLPWVKLFELTAMWSQWTGCRFTYYTIWDCYWSIVYYVKTRWYNWMFISVP